MVQPFSERKAIRQEDLKQMNDYKVTTREVPTAVRGRPAAMYLKCIHTLHELIFKSGVFSRTSQLGLQFQDSNTVKYNYLIRFQNIMESLILDLCLFRYIKLFDLNNYSEGFRFILITVPGHL